MYLNLHIENGHCSLDVAYVGEGSYQGVHDITVKVPLDAVTSLYLDERELTTFSRTDFPDRFTGFPRIRRLMGGEGEGGIFLEIEVSQYSRLAAGTD